MSEIKLFGASTVAGKYLKNNYSKYLNQTKLESFSRSNESDVYFDLNSSLYPKEIYIKNNTLIISLAPIWLFVPFFKRYINSINKKNIKGLILTSSTSINTKKYCWNKFDKKLYSDLSYWEEELININRKYGISITIIRTSMIYGDIGYKEDKNISFIIKLMNNSIFLPIPKETGVRQPIHYSQLIKCILKISKNYLNSSINNNSKLNILNIGGDEELSYEKIFIRIQENLGNKSLLSRCFLIKIPNRIFFLILSPVLLFSPKWYESILRISINMGDFKPSYKIHGENKSKFPLRIKK